MRKLRFLSLFVMSMAIFGALFGEPKIMESVDDSLENITREAASQGYDEGFIELVEMVYGEGFLSQGGKQSVEAMIGDLDLNHARVLDIGSGIGGPSIYLAKRYYAHIVGLEPQKWMVDRAAGYAMKQKEKLKGSVDFILMESTSNLQQFPDDSFDVILSKETLLHIPKEVKPKFFAEIYRVLKPGGHIILMDWMCTATRYSKSTEKMMELDGVAYNLISYEEYLQILQHTGFTEIGCEDITMETGMLSQKNVDTVLSLESKIKSKYDADVFHESLNSWQWQRDAFQAGELKAGIFKARKL